MPEYELALLYANWCGHCKIFYPENEKIDDANKKDNENKNTKKGRSRDLTWGQVKEQVRDKISCVQFEEGDLEKEHEGYDMNDIKHAPQGWPTLLFLVKENKNDNFKPHSYFGGDRTNIEEFYKAIDKVKSGKAEQLSGGATGGGIQMVNRYRTKYKKYKQLYADLLVKYKQLKH